jgi:hypothetical protein
MIPLGIVILSKEEHPLKVPDENVVNEHSSSAGKMTSDRLVQSSNKYCPVEVQNFASI